MTLDAILLARALLEADDAEILFRMDTARRATDWADVHALAFWRATLDVLRRHETYAARFEAFVELGLRDAVSTAMSIPLHVIEAAGPTADLVAEWNAGRGTAWRYPVQGEQVTKLGQVPQRPTRTAA